MERKKRSFNCYFCNKQIEDESEMGHTSVCGKVLLPCPNKCGAYIPRTEMAKHRKECVNRIDRSSTRLAPSSAESNSIISESPDNRNMRDLVFKLRDELRMHTTRMADLERKNQNLQQLELHDKPAQVNLIRQDLEKIKYQSQLIQEWRRMVDLKLDHLKQATRSCEQFQGERDLNWMGVQQKLMIIDRLQFDINILRDNFLKEQIFSKKVAEEFAIRFDEFQDLYKEENAAVGALWSDQKVVTDDIRRDCDNFVKLLDDNKAKLTNVIFDVKTVSQIASEAADRIEIMERDFNTVRKHVEQMKLDMEILENIASDTGNAACSTPGHLLWKISEFDSKLITAKDMGGVLKSQIFYSHEFGYKIRILVHLNGLKKWKDRYALISVHVLRGDFDALLKWPCRIEGTVTLRDQENLDNPTDFSKYISAKRECGGEETEEPQESSSSYIFIPHSTLTKSKYCKDDTIYLEVRMNKLGKSTETTL